jgi:hypothetical protein
VLPGAVPFHEQVSAVADRELLDLYSDVMGELMVRGRAEHRDHWGPEEESPGRLSAVDDAELLRIYRMVHDEMTAREGKRPAT